MRIGIVTSGLGIARQCLRKNTSVYRTCRRQVTGSGSPLDLNVDSKTGIAVLSMNKPPVNSLNLEFLTELNIALEKVENDKQCKGLIITSSIPKIFSAGLDITEMYQPDIDRLEEFWRTLQDMWIKLYGMNCVTIAAINGHSPAGGCLMSMSCDYRIMSPKYTIGLNETQLVLTQHHAGLDITEMYQPDIDRLEEFWRTLQDMWIKLYGMNCVTIAAINGHSPAGGCLMSMSCDYRIMAPNYTIGLNETQLGIVAPFWFADVMLNTVGFRQTEMALQLGTLFKTEEALNIGLIDKVVPQEEVLSAAQQEMQRWFKIPGFARQLSKTELRRPTIEKLLKKKEEDIGYFRDYITKDAIQKSLGMYLESLKNRRK
uniref:Enoyl-CoA delta isomerase 1, mitochondrial n=1 Tax=Magallana gigas TaxID=29159 RepID=K1Q3R9_MAGGI